MKKLQLDDFTKYKFLSGIALSPDSKLACFVVHESNVEENKYDSNLWIYNLETEKSSRLTGFNRESNFLWLEDGENILFSSIRGEQEKKRVEQGESLTQYYRINVHGGEAEKLFQIPLHVTKIKEIDAHNFIMAAIYDPQNPDVGSLSEVEKSRELKKRKEEKDYEIIDEIPFWSNGSGFSNKKRNRLYLYNVSNQQYVSITDELTSVQSFSLNPGKGKVVFTAKTYQDMYPLTNGIFMYDIEKQTTEKLLDEKNYACSYVDFINDHQLVFVATDQKRNGINENNKFYVLDLHTKGITCLTPNLDIAITSTVGSDCRYGSSTMMEKDGECLFYITTENDSSFLNKLNLKDGSIEKLTNEKGSVDGFTVKRDNILLIGLRNLKLQEIYSLKDKQEHQITSFNTWVNEEITLAKPESLKVETSPDIWIDGWVIKPIGFDESKTYPAILNIHGGPKTVYGEIFYHEMQLWANEGYFVFFCNPRGSDGKGNDFADIRGKYGTIDYDDIMGFTDEVLAQYPNIDQQRVGVTGGSYGGFMTNWIIGHTDRFKAAASQRSISNWISKFGTTDIGYFFVEDQQGATPWNDPDKLWWHSPLKYADKVKTPTLFIHSDEDYRCWITEVYQMFTALKFHGVESRLCIFRGENHELSRSGKPKHRIRRLEEITNWFNQYLKD